MSSHTHDKSGLQPDRLAMFAAVFIAGLIGGIVFTSTLAHSQQARPDNRMPQASGVARDVVTVNADPSLPDAGTVLRARRSERPEPVAPTF